MNVRNFTGPPCLSRPPVAARDVSWHLPSVVRPGCARGTASIYLIVGSPGHGPNSGSTASARRQPADGGNQAFSHPRHRNAAWLGRGASANS